MDDAKKKRLASKGWKVGTTADFLGLSTEESDFLELKLSFSRNLKAKRSERNLTQKQLAKMINSSQSRVAKMESGDPSVSFDLLIRSMLALGMSKRELAGAISQN
jgi:ribosome-binding protein aMBF1 (putative translation factor)